MNKLRWVVLGGLSLLAVGCAGDLEKLVELEEEKAAAYEKAGDDCDAIAKAAEEFKEKNGSTHKELRENLKAKYKDDEDAGKKAMEPYEDRMKKASKVITRTVIKCMDNDAYAKAIKD